MAGRAGGPWMVSHGIEPKAPVRCAFTIQLSHKIGCIAAAAAAAKSLQLCPTLCDPIDESPPGSPIPGIVPRRGKNFTFSLPSYSRLQHQLLPESLFFQTTLKILDVPSL